VELGGWATKSVLVGSVGMPHRVAAGALRRRIPALSNISADEEGQLEAYLKEPDESLGRSILKRLPKVQSKWEASSAAGCLGVLGQSSCLPNWKP
jgi:hypothetical protein